MTQLLWQPTTAQIESTNLHQYLKYVRKIYGTKSRGYADLYRWSIYHPEDFWQSIWGYTGVIGDQGRTAFAPHERFYKSRFFPDAQLNYAENLLERPEDHDISIIFWNETKERHVITRRELKRAVAAVAAGLREAGVGVGDRVVGFMPNVPETIIAMLATASLGAVWASCSPDFGVEGVLDRFGQLSPKVLIATTGYLYSGKSIDTVAKVEEIIAGLPTLKQIISVSYINSRSIPQTDVKHALWHEYVNRYRGAELTYVRVPFNSPLFVMFSSGTTGKPKCIVHGVGGTLLQHLKEHQLHADIKPNDRVFYFTTCGWMMWNWLVSALASRATLMLYDGSPLAPNPTILLDYAEEEGISFFGVSAKYIDGLHKMELRPIKTHRLDKLRIIGSTGSPLVPESFEYIYHSIKKDVCVSSLSGGTDILSCFALGNPMGPVRCGELQALGLGMRVEVYDDKGKPLPAGEKGDLVCTAPFPCMPLGFWDDKDDVRFREAYFERFPNVWHHGDFVERTSHGGLIIYGRSDAVLNPGGVRIGTAEIYRQVEQIPEVQESIAVGQDWDHDVRVILFVKLKPGHTLDNTLIERIRQQIRSHTSPRHVPAKVIQVVDIPRTKSGKIVELAVRDVIHGRKIKNIQALANPEALEFFKNITELQN
jgi:acetoacetyl-CoA synthetase